MISQTIKSSTVARERFQANYGTEAVVAADVWLRLMSSRLREKNSLKPNHLLWSQSYGKQREMAPKNKCDEKTWRNWVWKGRYAINHLKKDVVRALLLLTSILQRSYLLWLSFRCCCCCCCCFAVAVGGGGGGGGVARLTTKLDQLSNIFIRDSQQRFLMVVDALISESKDSG
jgi:hypothetical protein